ncbi:leucine-rich repeat transmembrane neuronal protein 1-like [Scleropages formosus]|uniref:Leucine-rich repeat transmembrane neuronal protein 1-like n=2 Tax=Scleropages formosus TaxID=113540 RepID=A0A0P7V953_SCLFO|nr:leucine-rich repeat transmembrane neuronal protein 1-like [Scleropages formosus]KPP78730.1 leucine-rich repeat transmembrane neuronal protein 1-like [Scleropages formosus]
MLMDFLLIGLYQKWLLRKPPGLILCSLGILLKMVPMVGAVCPRLCRCDNKLLYCEGLNLTDVPRNLSSAMGLSLRENNLVELREGHFSGLSQLTWLYLGHNTIELVEENAFERLRRVKELDLSANRIESLSNGTFRPMPNLRILDLSYNKLQALEPDLFHGLRKLTNLHLRYNALKFVPVRIFQDCRSMQFLDLGYNQLQSLARNSFAGLFKLTELHLEHNELVKVNLAHFPRLISLRALYMRRNKATIVVNTLDWTWHFLEKIDFSGNEIEYIEPHVFESVPNLKSLQLDSNRLTFVDQRTLDSWRSLHSITLSANDWECTRNVCALASWLNSFQGQRDSGLQCASPDSAQGEDVLDAVYAFQLCEDPVDVTTQVYTFTKDRARGYAYGGPTGNPYDLQDTEGGEVATHSFTVTVATDDMESTMQIHKVVTGTMALIFSFLIVMLMLYVSWKCFPAGVRQMRQCFSSQRRKQKQKQSMQQVAAMTTPEYYVDYKPNHIEGALVIINEYGSCTCQQQPSRECEV